MCFHPRERIKGNELRDILVRGKMMMMKKFVRAEEEEREEDEMTRREFMLFYSTGKQLCQKWKTNKTSCFI